MNIWFCGAAVLMAALACCVIVSFRGSPMNRLAGLEMTGVIVILQLVLLCEGLNRPSLYDLPLTLVFLSFGGGLVFVRFLQRWL